MKLLQNKFNKNGYQYELVQRNAISAIFSQKIYGKIIAYEVIKIKILPKRQFKNTTIDEGEYYPATNEWGINGWTYKTIDKAVQKMEEITKNIKQNKKATCDASGDAGSTSRSEVTD